MTLPFSPKARECVYHGSDGYIVKPVRLQDANPGLTLPLQRMYLLEHALNCRSRPPHPNITLMLTLTLSLTSMSPDLSLKAHLIIIGDNNSNDKDTPLLQICTD